ncbi:MAG TPA: 3-ketoacyl-ACP reductase [Blastocatellia bacterium]|nr:3-ketoacyl-ACP reductase [Blastocatellia bacterium]
MNDRRPVAFITGASRGIGRGIAVELARHGYDIAGSSRVLDSQNSESGILEVKQRVEESGATFLPAQGDVSILDDHDRMIKTIVDHFGRIDLLVNNAGVSPDLRLDVLETTPESFDRVMSINSRGPFFLTQAVARQMLAQIQAAAGIKPKIIFITSVSAYMSSTSRAEYCLSKAALSMAAAIFADRLSVSGINVYEVRPGIIKTEMTATVQEKYDRLIDEGLIPQGRWGLPEDVGKAVVALVSGGFEYSTGAVIEVSGGMNVRRL